MLASDQANIFDFAPKTKRKAFVSTRPTRRGCPGGSGTGRSLESSVATGPLAAQERARHRADRERIRERLDIRPHVPLIVQHHPGIGRQAQRVHELEARRRRIGNLEDSGVDEEEFRPSRGDANYRGIRAIAVVSRAIVGPADIAPPEILPGVAASIRSTIPLGSPLAEVAVGQGHV